MQSFLFSIFIKSQIAIGGDLFQSRASQTLDVLLAVHDALLEAEKRQIEIIIANGNHDKVNQEAIRGYCHAVSYTHLTLPTKRIV